MRRCFVALSAMACLVAAGCPATEKPAPEPQPPVLSSPDATPASVYQGNSVRLSILATSSWSAIATVTMDLSAIVAGLTAQPMYDDGSNGDILAGDGRYTYLLSIATDAPTGPATLPVTATDADGRTATSSIFMTVVLNTPPVASNGTISRDPVPPGGRVLVTVDASDTTGTITSVTANLTALGGSASAALNDGGLSGDASAGDGTWSLELVASASATPGTGLQIQFTATDMASATGTASVTFDVSSNVAPQMTGAAVTPSSRVQRLDVLFSVTVTDTDGLASVTIDLSSLNGSGSQALYDNGTNGDVTSGDGIYSFRYTLPSDAPAGSHDLIMTATDSLSETNWAEVRLTVYANNPPVLSSPLASPNPTPRNNLVLFSIQVTDADGSVQSVTMDLTALGGTATEALYDNGTFGDATASDQTWSLSWLVQSTAPVGTLTFNVTATDDDTVTATSSIPLTTLTNITPTASNPTATPNPQQQGLTVLLTVDATDDSGVSSVTVDLSALGGTSADTMYDNGTHGDAVSGNGTWSLTHTIPGAALGAYALTYTVTDTGSATDTISGSITVSANQPPVLSNKTISPALAQPGQTVLVTVQATDPHGVGSVVIDISGVQRAASQAMYDDGTHGDVTASNGVYSISFTPGAASLPGSKNFAITATDTLTASSNTTVALDVVRFKLEHACFLEGIHGSSASNIYTVGDFGEVFHYDGSVWRMEDPRPGVNVSWFGVWCESASSVWIGGDAGRVSFGDGVDWTARDTGQANYTVRSFWPDGAGKVWAVGGRPGNRETSGWTPSDSDDGYLLVAWNNSTSSWGTATTTTNGDDLNDIFGVSATDIVAVGDDGLILHYNGSTWDSSKSLTTNNDLYGVWGYRSATTTYYWAVAGVNSGTAVPTIYSYSSAAPTWAPVAGTTPSQATNLKGIFGSVSGSSLSEIYVAGTQDSNPSIFYGSVWRSIDGVSFAQVTNPSPPWPYSANYFPYAPYRLYLMNVWMPGPNQGVWISGHRSLQHYVAANAPPWTEDSRGTYEDTRAVSALSSTRAIAWDYPSRPTTGVQGGSQVHHFVSGVWDEYRDNTGNIGPALETHTMLNQPSGLQGPICPRIYAVKMFSASAVYGVGDDGHVYFWDGTVQTTHDFTSQHQYGVSSTDQRRLYALWGLSASDFWFGGEGARVYHYQGTNWSTSPPAAATLPGTTRVVTGLWGSSGSNVYAVLAQTGVDARTTPNLGDIFQYNGASWASIAGANSMPAVGSLANLNCVWGTASNDVYVVGDGGFARHWNGSTWTNLSASLGGTTADLNAVFGDLTSGDVYIAGAGFRVWVRSGGTWYSFRANSSTGAFMGGDASGTLALIAGSKGMTLRLEK